MSKPVGLQAIYLDAERRLDKAQLAYDKAYRAVKKADKGDSEWASWFVTEGKETQHEVVPC